MLSSRLDFGLETISLWSVDDEVHLPSGATSRPVFDGESRALDKLLDRPTLDERTSSLMVLSGLDKDLAITDVLAAARAGALEYVQSVSTILSGSEGAKIADLHRELSAWHELHAEIADKVHEFLLRG